MLAGRALADAREHVIEERGELVDWHVVATEKRARLLVEIVSRSLSVNGSSRADVTCLLRDLPYPLFQIDDDTAALRALADVRSIDEQNIRRSSGGLSRLMRLPSARDACHAFVAGKDMPITVTAPRPARVDRASERGLS